MQADVNKQRIAQAKIGREDRRVKLDMMHHFLIEQVAVYCDLKPKEVEEFIIDSAGHILLMDKFFEKKGSKCIVFVYQEADYPGIGKPIQY